ncbi:hypothetical protein MGMO_17c00260 [Methyloglobulus morosus KoM1]|uniref:Phosphoribosyl-ATP pyrophosphohydrolase n=1 Tax=Methyloglobulus morosus KoM1 TaxID=1116472 RepID=V5E1Y4_9GAMM|nr:nucleoside triphosphate pyrophosphohydrolase family protein [Methyloglobulus morosus]ESS73561.1 hypothetical protein MGMO_17c00260 [Methyloglobulus morosus KoM1]
MNGHLKSVREFHEALLFPQAGPGTTLQLSDMEIIRYQALLMEAGSEVLKAIKAGEMAEMLVGLVDLAYVALAAIAMQGRDVIDKPVFWQHDGFVLSVMEAVSDKINRCASGSTDQYSEVYCLCIHLVRSFVNADFDKAFQMIHNNNLSRVKKSGESLYGDTDNIRKLKLHKSPDLSECLYE